MYPKFFEFLNANVICQVNPSDKSHVCDPRPLPPPLSLIPPESRCAGCWRLYSINYALKRKTKFYMFEHPVKVMQMHFHGMVDKCIRDKDTIST